MMLRSELKSLVVWAHHTLRKQPTLKSDEIPNLYREPGVLTGYRLPGQSMFTYVVSAFQLNNETVNIWTHFIGFIVVFFRTLFLLDEFGADDPRIFPLLGFGVCCLMYTALSVIAHTFHSASPSFHYTCFQADYAGIGLYAFGSALPVFYLSADNQTRTSFSFWFIPVNFAFSWVCFLCCCIAKLKYRRPYPFRRKLWQIIPFGCHALMCLAFLYRRVSKCSSEEDDCDDPPLYTYKKIVVLAVTAGLTFSSHLPEKLWPGYFDLIGQGHHVFHIVSIILTLAQFDAAHEDILHSNQYITPERDALPSSSCLLCVIFGLSVCSVLTIVSLRPFVVKRVRDDERFEQKRE